ncbi:alkaline phosphatase [Georgenia wangjunii]|uniref:alkaline phosphatase n=1 Tax=Georgenia wangjunii TaxID=3117730 RepID=UPI002F2655FC
MSLAVVPSVALANESDHGGAVRKTEDRTAALEAAIMDGPATNVILIIGDGMGASEITVARNYAEGASGTLPGLDPLLVTGQKTTYDLTPDGDIHYAADSASTASAWSTGTKTYTGALSVDVDNTPQDTVLEIAKANGLKTGNVSTSEIQDATPAALYAHVNQRQCYGPTVTTENCPTFAKENGGLGSITEQLLDARPDVVLGGGNATMSEIAVDGPWAGLTLEAQAAERGYTYLTDSAALTDVSTADQAAPVLGLFTEGNFPVRYAGPAATEGGGDLPAARCSANPDWDPATSLGSMTGKAIELLDTDEEGFFLQVESASIDKRDHAADACGQIGETLELDEAVQAAVAFAETDGETLVIVTADHSHTSQIVGSTPPGLSVNLLTEDGQEMIVAYGTAPEGGSQQHTGASVPIAAYGPGAANVAGLTDDTDTFFTTMSVLGLNGDLASLSASASVVLDPSPVAPGAPVTVSTSGLNGDRQVVATLGGEPIGQADVIDGVALFDLTAPEAVGEHPVVLTGLQTGTELTESLVVSEAPVPPPAGNGDNDGDDGDDREDGDGAGTGGNASGGLGAAPPATAGSPLPFTGADVTQAGLLALLLLGAGTAAVRLRGRRAVGAI